MIHVLTLSWNGLDKLQRLKDGLFRNLKKLDGVVPYKWYIRDNGSHDGTAQEVLTWEKTTLKSMSHNRDNFAKGMNSLVDITSIGANDKFLFLNNDVQFVDDNSIEKMYNLLVSKQAGAVGARLLYTGTNNLQHAGVIFGQRYGGMPYHYRHKEMSDAAATKNRQFQAVTAAVCLVDANAFRAAGGFDEKFSWAFEDIDLCLRIGKIKPVIYCGETNIYHEESASLKKNPVNKMFLSSNVTHFKSKWNGKYEIDHDKYLANPEFNVVK